MQMIVQKVHLSPTFPAINAMLKTNWLIVTVKQLPVIFLIANNMFMLLMARSGVSKSKGLRLDYQGERQT